MRSRPSTSNRRRNFLPKLLLEIGCEELPASACYEAEAQLPALCERHLGAAPARLYIGPRRLGEHLDEGRTLVERRLPLPAYDQVLKASHALNLLDARGALSVTERADYILRIRNLARAIAQLYLEMEAEASAEAAA